MGCKTSRDDHSKDAGTNQTNVFLRYIRSCSLTESPSQDFPIVQNLKSLISTRCCTSSSPWRTAPTSSSWLAVSSPAPRVWKTRRGCKRFQAISSCWLEEGDEIDFLANFCQYCRKSISSPLQLTLLSSQVWLCAKPISYQNCNIWETTSCMVFAEYLPFFWCKLKIMVSCVVLWYFLLWFAAFSIHCAFSNYACTYLEYKVGAEAKKDFGAFGLMIGLGSVEVTVMKEFFVYTFFYVIS